MRAARFAACATIAASFLALFMATWNRFGHLLIDTYMNEWVGYQLARGYIYYRDVYDHYGLLPAYSLALLYRIFGRSLYPSMFLSALITGLTATLVYRLSRRFLTRTWSTLLVIHFFVVLAFNDLYSLSIFNYIRPYVAANTQMMLFTLLALWLYERFVKRAWEGASRHRDLVPWAAAMCLVFLCRPENGLVTWAAFVGAALLMRKLRSSPTPWLVLGSPPVVSAGIYGAYLLAFGCARDFYTGVLKLVAAGLSGSDAYARWGMGIYNISKFDKNDGDPTLYFAVPTNLAIMLVSFAAQIGLAALFVAVGVLASRLRAATLARKAGISLAIVALLAGGGILAISLPDYYRFRGAPLVLLLGIVAAWVARTEDPQRAYSSIVLLLLALASLSRMIFRVDVVPYGFYALVPGLIGYYLVFLDLTPALARRYLPDRRVYHWLWAAVIVFHGFQLARTTYAAQTLKVFQMSTPQGTLRVFPYCNVVFAEAFAYLRDHTPKGTTVVAFPEGVGLNYLLDRQGLRYLDYHPHNIATVGEEQIIRELHERRIDYVVVFDHSQTVFGYRRFGTDYARELGRSVQEHYSLVQHIAPSIRARYWCSTADIYRRNE